MRFIIAIWIWTCAAVAEPVVVFAAASLKEPIDALAEGRDVVVSYGGSGTLARQVMRGAPADVILLANADWMDQVVGVVPDIAPADFASNALVLIGPAGSEAVALDTLPMRLGAGPLAMGFSTAVPAGIYGRQALTALGHWDALAGRVAEVDNVRGVVALVARGEAPLGVTYATDANVSDAVAELARFDPATHERVRYVGAALTPKGAAFWGLVRGDEGLKALMSAGFLEPVQ